MPYTKTSAEFKELYREWSNDQLIEIVTKPENFQPNAVQAAETILKERHIDYKLPVAAEEPDEYDEEISYKELVEEEVAGRLNSGESPEAVLKDLKDRGINSADFLPGVASDQDFNPGKKSKKGYLLLVLLVILKIIFLIYKFG